MTIAELIAKLQQYPADMPVLIRDADTDWDVPIIHFEEPTSKDQRLHLFGKYSEMID